MYLSMPVYHPSLVHPPVTYYLFPITCISSVTAPSSSSPGVQFTALGNQHLSASRIFSSPRKRPILVNSHPVPSHSPWPPLTPSLSLRIGLLWTFPTHGIHTTGRWVPGISHGASCVQGPSTLQPESQPHSCSWLRTIPRRQLAVCVSDSKQCRHIHQPPLLTSHLRPSLLDTPGGIYSSQWTDINTSMFQRHFRPAGLGTGETGRARRWGRAEGHLVPRAAHATCGV